VRVEPTFRAAGTDWRVCGQAPVSFGQHHARVIIPLSPFGRACAGAASNQSSRRCCSMSFGVVPRCGGPCTTSSDVGHSQSRVSPIGRRCRARRSISKQTRRRSCGETTELDRWFFQPRELQVRYPNNTRGLCCRTHWEPVFLASRGKAGISAGFDNSAIAVLIPSRSLIMRMHVGNTERLHRHPIPLCHAKEGCRSTSFTPGTPNAEPRFSIHANIGKASYSRLHYLQETWLAGHMYPLNGSLLANVVSKRLPEGISWLRMRVPALSRCAGREPPSGKMKVVNS